MHFNHDRAADELTAARDPLHHPGERRVGQASLAVNAPRRPHAFHDREDGLQHCKVCGGAEGSLLLCCPGRMMTADEQDGVLNQSITSLEA